MDYRKEMDFIEGIVKRNASEYKYSFPNPQSTDYIYYHAAFTGWGDGFFNGMQMLSYEDTKDPVFLESAKDHLKIFEHRLDYDLGIDHHDMGFLYSLGCVSIYKVTGDEHAKEVALRAADRLMGRYVPKGKFIRAWGKMNDPVGNRLIIDCLLNIPLLFWATEVTGDNKYREVAEAHLDTTLKVIIRDDFTTFHTYFFDPQTGAPDHGQTAQGASDDSVWARGQAWGVYGAALAYHYTRDEKLIEIFKGLTRKFVELLPSDYVPYWDMIFSDGSGEERDTSAAAIVACGVLLMRKYMDVSEFMPVVENMLAALSANYTARRLDFKTNIILTDAMYSKPAGHKAEANIWGDYFYTEAVYRMLNPDWKMYW